MRLRRNTILNALPVLAPPTNVTAEVSGSDIIISWTAASSVDGYYIYQQIDDGAWTKLNTTATTDLTYTLTPTEPGEYNFRVTSVRGDKESAPNAETLCDGMMEQVYSDTITGLRISAVDGTAFVDGDEFLLAAEQTPVSDTLHIATKDGEAMFFHDSIDFSAYAGTDAGSTPYRFVFTDAAGKKAEAWGGDVGGGETLGGEQVTNGTFEAWSGADPDGWTSFTYGTSAISKETTDVYSGSNAVKITTDASASNVGLYSNDFTDNGSLYVISTFAKSDDATRITIWPDANNTSGGLSGYKSYSLTSTYTEYTFINTARADTCNILVNRRAGHASMSILFDNIDVKKYTDIPATGLHLMSTMNGTTRNMASVDPDFNPNTVTSVKVYHALADGNHLLEIEDSLGNVASGVLSAQGSGEVLGSELVTGWTNGSSISYDTLATSGANITSAIATSEAIAYEDLNGHQTKLLKHEFDVTVNSGSFGSRGYTQRGGSEEGIIGGGTIVFNPGPTTGPYVKYSTQVLRYLNWWVQSAIDLSVTNVSVKQVIAPSTSGALIVSEISGATQNFVSIPAGFQFNRTSYICRVKKILPTA